MSDTRIFLSFASEDRDIAEQVYYALNDSYYVFFDNKDLQGANNFHEEIEDNILESDLFIFLVSPDSVQKKKYALAELNIAKTKWKHPKGRVLPVMIRDTPIQEIPNYLKAVTIMEPEGNIAPEVRRVVKKLVSKRGKKRQEPEVAPKKNNGGVLLILLFLLFLLFAFLVFEFDILDLQSTPGLGKDFIKNR